MKTSHEGYDNPAMFDAVVDKYFKMKTKQENYKTDWSRQDKPHTVPNETHKFDWYHSPVKNSHQYPNYKQIRPPLYDHEIPPKTTSFYQRKFDKEPFYVGRKKYTRDNLPNRYEPEFK